MGNQVQVLQFKARSSASTGYFFVGLAQIGLGLLLMNSSMGGMIFLLCGGLMIWLSRWFATTAILELHEEALWVDPAPTRTKFSVAYANIRTTVRKGHVLELHLHDRMVKVPLGALQPDDVPRAIEAIEARRTPMRAVEPMEPAEAMEPEEATESPPKKRKNAKKKRTTDDAPPATTEQDAEA